MYAIFKFEKSAKVIDEMFKDDLISRQTVIKKDGKSLGMDDAIYLLVEGSEEAVEKAKQLANENLIEGKEAEEVYRKIKEAEDQASLGMGAIFG